MKRRACKNCNKWDSQELFGKIIDKKEDDIILSGYGKKIIRARHYTVQCAKCGRIWYYRKNI